MPQRDESMSRIEEMAETQKLKDGFEKFKAINHEISERYVSKMCLGVQDKNLRKVYLKSMEGIVGHITLEIFGTEKIALVAKIFGITNKLAKNEFTNLPTFDEFLVECLKASVESFEKSRSLMNELVKDLT